MEYGKGSFCLHQEIATIQSYFSSRNVSSAVQLAQDGLYGKAYQALVSSGVAPNNDVTWQLLVSKHPSSACPTVPIVPEIDLPSPGILTS